MSGSPIYEKEIVAIILYTSCFFMIVAFFLVAFFYFSRKKIILKELEKWAAELNYTKCVLETGKKQPEAITLYLKNGYAIIPNYGQYIGIENSVCFAKVI